MKRLLLLLVLTSTLAAPQLLTVSGTDNVDENANITFNFVIPADSSVESANLYLWGGSFQSYSEVLPTELDVSGGGYWNVSNGVVYNDTAKVGIGVNGSESRLDVSDDSPPMGVISRLVNPSGSGGAGLQLTQNGLSDWVIGQPPGVDAFSLWHDRNTQEAGVEVLRVDSSGDLDLLGNNVTGVNILNSSLLVQEDKGMGWTIGVDDDMGQDLPTITANTAGTGGFIMKADTSDVGFYFIDSVTKSDYGIFGLDNGVANFGGSSDTLIKPYLFGGGNTHNFNLTQYGSVLRLIFEGGNTPLIQSRSGEISFDDEDLTTTGSIAAGGATMNGDLGMSGNNVTNVANTAYGSGWDGDTSVPTKDAVYDKINQVHGCCFRVGLSSDQSLSSGGWSRIEWNSEEFDKGGNFGSYNFTAPEDGVYSFSVSIRTSNTAWSDGDYVIVSVYKNGSSQFRIDQYEASAGDSDIVYMLGGSWRMELSSGDYIEIYVYPTLNVDISSGHSFFGGHRIC